MDTIVDLSISSLPLIADILHHPLVTGENDFISD
jgi:hypothetical protein